MSFSGSRKKRPKISCFVKSQKKSAPTSDTRREIALRVLLLAGVCPFSYGICWLAGSVTRLLTYPPRLRASSSEGKSSFLGGGGNIHLANTAEAPNF